MKSSSSIDGTVTHAVNAPKMDLSNIDDTAKSFINLSQTVGELAIQLMHIHQALLNYIRWRLSL